MNTTDKNYLQKLFIDEAKPALSRHSGGGCASDPAAEAVMALIGMSKASSTGNYSTYPPDGVFVMSGGTGDTTKVIIPPNITVIDMWDMFDELYNLNAGSPLILSLPALPPTVTKNLGSKNSQPKAIYVPDGSVDAYKAAENWSEFADLIKPMSELTDGSDDSGGETEETLITFTIEELGEFSATEGMTWRKWCTSDYNNTDTMWSTAMCDPNKEIVAFNGDNAMPLYMSGADDVEVHPDDVIVAGATYYR